MSDKEKMQTIKAGRSTDFIHVGVAIVCFIAFFACKQEISTTGLSWGDAIYLVLCGLSIVTFYLLTVYFMEIKEDVRFLIKQLEYAESTIQRLEAKLPKL
jgi:hypothetical protein